MSTFEKTLSDSTVGEIAARLAGATAIFRRHKIDFCCGGNVPLAEAAAKRGVDAAALVQSLKALGGRAPDAPAATPALIDHILARYHAVHRQELPELIKLARRVESVHREHPDVPAGLADLLQTASAELEAHMQKEEEILFPWMLRGAVPFGPIGVMREEHDDHARTIRVLQEITHGYTPPAGACRSWQALYTGIDKLVTDLTEHIHLENNVLFPRFETPRG